VAAGHYFQGRLGRRLWNRLQTYGTTGVLPKGAEDEAAFAEGIGFADIVRRPTPTAGLLSVGEKREGAKELLQRLHSRAPGRPLIAFVYADAVRAAGALLEEAGYRSFLLRGPYVRKAVERRIMADFASRLRQIG